MPTGSLVYTSVFSPLSWRSGICRLVALLQPPAIIANRKAQLTIDCLDGKKQRRGIPFSAMVLKFGNMGPQYDPDYVAEITNKASSIYFVNLVVMQFFNLLATRTRRLSIFQQPPLFNKQTQNPLLFIAVVWSLVIIFICEL